MGESEKAAITEDLSPAAASRDAAAGLTRAEWLVLLVLSAVQFTHIVDFMIVMPLGPTLMKKETLDLSPQQFGFIVSAYAFSASLAGLFAARFMDRFDRKTALLWLYTGFTLGTLACALASDYRLLLAARAVAGAFGGVVAACILAIIGDAFPDSRRGRATGVVMSAFSLASIAGVPAGLYLANLLGWRAPFGLLAGLGTAVLVLVRFVLPPMRRHLGRTYPDVVKPGAVLLLPTHVRGYVLMTALVLSTFMIVPYMASYLVANAGRSEDELPYVYLCGGLATLVTMTLFGRLADRFGKLLVFRILALLTLVPIVAITNLTPVSLTAALLVSTLFMVVSSGRMVPAMALLTACAAPRHRGSFLSVNAAVQQMAAGLASLLGGVLLSQTSSGEMTGFPLVGVLAVAATLVSVWLAGRLRAAEGGEEAAVELDTPTERNVGVGCPAAAD